MRDWSNCDMRAIWYLRMFSRERDLANEDWPLQIYMPSEEIIHSYKVGTVPTYLGKVVEHSSTKESFVLFGIKAPTNFGLWWPI